MRNNQSGFTLLEIMLVVTIIALLLGTAIYKLSGNVEYARHNRVAADIQSISTQLKLYESMNGFYPTPEQGLEALVVQPSTDPAAISHAPHHLCIQLDALGTGKLTGRVRMAVDWVRIYQ